MPRINKLEDKQKSHQI